ncbi:AraC family transcriptional regulator [Oleiphilus messinensis]|uniref:AraC family transcriptional regulator n=1 Tax=Oleiphilus messinensis TaxID=141451 RepID=A0A1Y0IGC5_9GAMM|nr:AraC family transcriptional regulator [Oleiphilus messinensis]ARU58453.1 AraC family transcriptional regulator [Oleiphilus messinensis]
MDKLGPLFSYFSPRAEVFHAGTLCHNTDYQSGKGWGYLHLLRRGEITVRNGERTAIAVSEPSILFYPRPCWHRFDVDESAPPDLVCATINLGGSVGHPLSNMLPEYLEIPISEAPSLQNAMELLFAEAFNDLCGRKVALDRLMEYVLILLVRYLINTENYQSGVIAGLAHPKLALSLNAIHKYPDRNWSLETLADEAGMSRASFAKHFRTTLDCTPLDYLTSWRLSIAQSLLKRGQSIKATAPKVGYQSAAAFTRVFAQRMGISPSAFQQAHE